MARKHVIGVGAMVAATAAALIVLLPSRTIKEPHLRAPERLPLAARTALATQMRFHGERMSELVMAVALLDYPAVQATADRLATEPKLARSTSPDLLNASLPDRFFTLQAELGDRVASLGRAAGARDPEQLAAAFGETTRACVRCHNAYLEGR